MQKTKQKTKQLTEEDIQEEMDYIEAERMAIRDSCILYGNPEDMFENYEEMMEEEFSNY